MPLQRDARVVLVDDDTFFVDAMLVLLPQLGLARWLAPWTEPRRSLLCASMTQMLSSWI
jgi:hypothetical protein